MAKQRGRTDYQVVRPLCSVDCQSSTGLLVSFGVGSISLTSLPTLRVLTTGRLVGKRKRMRRMRMRFLFPTNRPVVKTRKVGKEDSDIEPTPKETSKPVED